MDRSSNQAAAVANSADARAYDWRKAHQLQKWNEQNAAQAHRWTMEARRNNIQTIVADAKAAGLHPLYALGAGSAPGFSALPASGSGGPVIPGQSPSGSFAGDAMRGLSKAAQAALRKENAYEKQQSRYERRLNQRLLETQIMEAKARAARSLASVTSGVSPGAGATTAAKVLEDVATSKGRGLPGEIDPYVLEQGSAYVRRDGTVGRMNAPPSLDEVRQGEYVVNEALHLLNNISELFPQDIRGPSLKGIPPPRVKRRVDRNPNYGHLRSHDKRRRRYHP